MASHAVLTKAFLQPVKTATVCMVCHDYACPPFLQAQNLPSQWSGPTVNMQPKLQYKYTHRSSIVKGLKYDRYLCLALLAWFVSVRHQCDVFGHEVQ